MTGWDVLWRFTRAYLVVCVLIVVLIVAALCGAVWGVSRAVTHRRREVNP